MISIVEHNLKPVLENNGVGQTLVNFVKWLQNNDLGKCTVSVRDYLAWTHFINHMTSSPTLLYPMPLKDAVIHGACMTILDGLGTGNTGGERYYLMFIQNFQHSLFMKNCQLSCNTTFRILYFFVVLYSLKPSEAVPLISLKILQLTLLLANLN